MNARLCSFYRRVYVKLRNALGGYLYFQEHGLLTP